MSGRSFIQKKRRAISWVIGSAVGGLVLVSGNRWDETGVLGGVFFVTGLLLIALAITGRLWSSLYISGYKKNTLVTVGPYSLCRHPLYFSSFLGAIGLGLCTESLTVSLIIVAAFLPYYHFVMRAEEKRLREIHGLAYDRYAAKTRRFLPALALPDEPQEYTVRPRPFRTAASDAMWFLIVIGLVELVETLHEHNVIPQLLRLY